MALNVEMITFDCDDPDKLAGWWAGALDGTVNAVAPGFFVTVTRPDGPGLSFQKVDDPTPGKNKVHIDFTASDMEAAVKRMVELGATETGRTRSATTSHGWCWPTPPATRSVSPPAGERASPVVVLVLRAGYLADFGGCGHGAGCFVTDRNGLPAGLICKRSS